MQVRQLGHLEATVMQKIWTWERPVLVREVLEELQRDREIAYTTVMTVMDNLHRKGFLVRERDGRAYRYTAAQSREQHTASVMEEVLASSTDRSATLMHFVQQIDDEELTALRSELARRAKGRGGRP